MERILFCEAPCCSHSINQEQKDTFIYYEDDQGSWHYYHEECFLNSEVEVVTNG